ncbi:Flp family type IVb pilin [Thalassobacillus hwangdonensis]|uniref:Flp family type IVb pilin n=1 Tax=Thalassobacillus hwangdonensis TaxID=546108 RepID=A0ABW3L426_9BACI
MIRKLLLDEGGQGMSEYGLVISFIAFSAFVTIIVLRENIVTMFKEAIGVVSEGNNVLHP